MCEYIEYIRFIKHIQEVEYYLIIYSDLLLGNEQMVTLAYVVILAQKTLQLSSFTSWIIPFKLASYMLTMKWPFPSEKNMFMPDSATKPAPNAPSTQERSPSSSPPSVGEVEPRLFRQWSQTLAAENANIVRRGWNLLPASFPPIINIWAH